MIMKFDRKMTPAGVQKIRQNLDGDPFARLPLEGSLTMDARTTLALLRVEGCRLRVRRLAHLSPLSQTGLAKAIRELSTAGFLVIQGNGESALLALTPDAKIAQEAA